MTYTVKQARLLSGKTQQEMADHLGVHVQTYAKLERNPEKMTIERAVKLSQVTGVPSDQIFFGNTLLKVDYGRTTTADQTA